MSRFYSPPYESKIGKLVTQRAVRNFRISGKSSGLSSHIADTVAPISVAFPYFPHGIKMGPERMSRFLGAPAGLRLSRGLRLPTFDATA